MLNPLDCCPRLRFCQAIVAAILVLLFALACDDECKADEEECRGDSIWSCENGDWVEILNCGETIEPDTDGAWTCCEVEDNGEFIPDCVQGGCE